jgi:hypothetical protein
VLILYVAHELVEPKNTFASFCPAYTFGNVLFVVWITRRIAK